MDKVAVICDKDRVLLTEFSKRSLGRVTGRSFQAFRLPFVGAYMEANVKKEVDKDRLIIEQAAELHAAGRDIRSLDVDAVFEATKSVDRKFVRSLTVPSFSLTVRYEDIAEFRKQRILRLSTAVHDILRSWEGDGSFEDALRRAYPEQRFREVLVDIMHLYNQETRNLSRSIRFFHPFNPAINFFADMLFESMEVVTQDLAAEYARLVYGGKLAHAQA